MCGIQFLNLLISTFPHLQIETMSIHFHPLRVKEIRKETADCVSVVFEIPEELKNDFAFNQGQSLSMRSIINGEEVRRTYSICSSPGENEWRVAIKKVEGGIFSS